MMPTPSRLLLVSSLCLALALAGGPAFAGPPPNPVPFPFYGLREYPAGNDVRHSAAADFDGDGWLDVAVTLGAGSAVAVLLNRGDGGLLPATSYAAAAGLGSTVRGILAKDVNGDGHADLVVENVSASNASLLIGNGDGTFQPFALVAGSVTSRTPALADVDGNQTLDLISIRQSPGAITLQRGNGDGTFQAVEDSPVTGGGAIHDFTVGDFNGDGAPDVALTRHQYWYVYLNNGSGTFTFSGGAQAGMPHETDKIESADLDGDGDLDLVVSLPGHQQIEILIGQGDGSFIPDSFRLDYSLPSPVGMTGTPGDIGLADLSGDGLPELFIGLTSFGGGPAARLLWHMNTSTPGDPAFGLAKQTLLVDAVDGLTFADLDRDGIANVLTGRGVINPQTGLGEALAVLSFWVESGVLETEQRQRIGLSDVSALAVGQIVGTPHAEIAFTGPGQTFDFSGYVENFGDRTFSPNLSGVFVTDRVSDIAVGNFDPANPIFTGCPDFAVVGANEIGMRQGDCNGGFVALYQVYSSDMEDVTEVETGDLDLDGNDDFVFAGATEGVAFRLSDGSGTFPFPAFRLVNNVAVSDLVLADMDRDGYLDFLFTADGDTLWILRNPFAGPGSTANDFEILPVDANLRALAVGDFDGDGFPDVAALGSNRVYLFRNQQDGTVVPDGEITGGIVLPNDLAAGDVDGDGRDDLAVLIRNLNGREYVSVYPASGSGGFESPYQTTVGLPGLLTTPTSVVLHDFDDDGFADLAVGVTSAQAAARGISVYHSRGPFDPVPEPTTSMGLLLGVLALAGVERRARRSSRS